MPHTPFAGAIPDDTERLRRYLEHLLAIHAFPPYHRRGLDMVLIAKATGIEASILTVAQRHIWPICDALCRALASQGVPVRPATTRAQAGVKTGRKVTPASTLASPPEQVPSPTSAPIPPQNKRGPKPRPIVDHTEPLWTRWDDPADFADALRLQVARHSDNAHRLAAALSSDGLRFDHHTLAKWVKGTAAPRSVGSLEALARVEQRYRLPDGYFRNKLPHQGRAISGHLLDDVPAAERRRLAWHLPDDFARRSLAEQKEILAWVRTTIISGSTEYRRFQAAAMKQRYAVRFRALDGTRRRTKAAPFTVGAASAVPSRSGHESIVVASAPSEPSSVVDAPDRLQREMTELLRFKTATLTAFGLQRNGVWGAETAAQKIEHFGLMFGALVASPTGEIRGHGADLSALTFAALVFPRIWDWYLHWREARRGFYTAWEVDMLSIVLSLVKKDTGWLRQTPRLADHLEPIPGLISVEDIAVARADWNGACDAMHRHGRHRVREIKRVARVHRDPFEPILPVLEAKSPVGEYREITEEILSRMPDERRYPKATAEAVRSFLLLYLGLHTGLRQKNMREMLLCPPGRLPTSERLLEERKRRELRWNSREHGWEVLIPAVAFKNANSPPSSAPNRSA